MGLVLLAVGLIAGWSLLSPDQGLILEVWSDILRRIFGWGAFVVPLALLGAGAWLILRTSWVYGARGHNFFLTMLRLARERETLKIVYDQTGSPTWCRAIAECTAQILARAPVDDGILRIAEHLAECSGIYNVTCANSASWHGFARAILDKTTDKERRLRELVPITTDQYPLPAPRPAYSVLSGEKLRRRFGLAMPDWTAALETCIG